MNRALALAVVLATLVAACGSGDQQQQSSEPATESANRPPEELEGQGGNGQAKGFRTPGAPARPPSYKEAKAGRTSTAGDTYVHAHLDMGWLDHCLTNGQQVDWASNNGGACYGNFKDGSEPFTGGRAAWSSWGKQSRDSRIRIGMATMFSRDDPPRSNVGIDCYIANRASSDCYTDNGSHLQLTVSSGDYLLLRGMCKDGDPMCTPHPGSSLKGSRREDAERGTR